MPRLALTVRLAAYALLAFGIALLITAWATGERVNASGFVPGVAFGFLTTAVGTLSLVVADRIRERRYRRVAFELGLMSWLAASTFLVVWSIPAGSLRATPLGAVAQGVLVIGFIATLYIGFLIPLFSVVAWIADRIPALRRHGIGNEIRGNWRGRF